MSYRLLQRVVAFSSLLALSNIALAQDQKPPPEQRKPQERDSGEHAKPPSQAEKPPEQPFVEGAPVTARDYSPDKQQPVPPKPPEEIKPLAEGDKNVEVAVDAGVGSPLAYGRKTVVEVGGTLSFTRSSDTTTFTFMPQVGYFLMDGLELGFSTELRVVRLEGNTDFSIGAALEPSYHLSLSDALYVFGGLGIGVRYSEDPGADLFFRPRIGMDIMVGRSGILKPALFIDVGVNDGASAGGLEASFTVML